MKQCDRLIPTCSACIEASARCSPRQIRVEPSEDNSGLSHAALPGYVESLKQRIHVLESLSQRKRRRVAGEDAGEDAGDDATPSVPPDSHGGLDSSVQAAMGEIGFLSRSAMAEPRDGASGFPRQLELSEMLQAMLSLNGGSPSQSRSTDEEASQWNFLAFSDPLQALSRDSMAPFLDRFLQQISMFYLHFDRKELEEQYEGFFADSIGPSSDAVDSARSHRDFSVYLALAIGMLLSPQSGRVDLLAQGLHSAAVKLLPRILQSGNYLSLVHCLLLLIVYSMLSPNGGSSWHLLGLAMKRSIAFGLHKDQEGDSPLPVEIITKRRYLFWTLYMFDRTLCTIMDRPFGIQDEDISLSLPHQLSPNDEGKDAFELHLLMHAKLTSSMRDSDERCPVFHYRNICFWREVPRELRSFLASNEAARNHIHRLSCRVLVQVLPLYVTTGQAHSDFIPGSHQLEIEHDVRSSCEQMIEHMYRSLDHASSITAFTDGYDIFAAGVAIICIGSLSPSAHTLTDAGIVNKCVAILTALGERFSGVKVFRRVLLAVSDTALGKSDDISVCIPSLPHRFSRLTRVAIAVPPARNPRWDSPADPGLSSEVVRPQSDDVTRLWTEPGACPMRIGIAGRYI